MPRCVEFADLFCFRGSPKFSQFEMLKLLKNSPKSTYCACRHFTESLSSKNLTGESVSKYVVVSESRDIFENLALEDWLYENYDFSNREILLLWKNTPAVVIGRHQNPWLEANVEESISNGIQIVRRNSGGGTVYHDLGNLNLSFLTNRKVYNRMHNLEVIVRSLRKEWGIHTHINGRSDVIMNKKKISGTASKLSRKNAYHHCTLLVDVNKHFLSTSLRSPLNNTSIDTKATSSKSAPVMNLKEAESSVTVDRLTTIIGLEFLLTSNSDMTVDSKGFHLVKPTNQIFPGIDKKIDEFKSWNWIYGRTPEFTVTSNLQFNSDVPFSINFQIKVKAAVITDVNVQLPTHLDLNIPSKMIEHFKGLFLGKKYTERIESQWKELFSNEILCYKS